MAGFSAAGKIQNIICTVFVSFGATIATYVGQNRGAGKMDRVRKGVYLTSSDFELQLDYDGAGSFLWRVSDVDFRESIGDRSIEGSGNLL